MIKEIEDRDWFPAFLRRFQASFIGSVAVWLKIYRPMVPLIRHMTTNGSYTHLQDLCSGSGLSAIYMHRQLKQVHKTILTDKYPPGFFNGTGEIQYLQEPVDVINLNPVPGIFYSMYNSFHHFDPEQQRSLVKKMVRNRNAFFFAEILEPGVLTMVKVIFTTTILQLFIAPFIRPFSLLRLFFTYIIPVNLFTVSYDGIISVLKSGSFPYYQNLVSGLSEDGYAVTVHRFGNWKGAVICITGNPLYP